MGDRVLLKGACPVCGKAPSYSVTSGKLVEEGCSFINGLILFPEMPLSSELLVNWVQATWDNIKRTYEEQAYCSHCDKPIKVLVTEDNGSRGYSLSCGCTQTASNYTNFGTAYMDWRMKVLSEEEDIRGTL